MSLGRFAFPLCLAIVPAISGCVSGGDPGPAATAAPTASSKAAAITNAGPGLCGEQISKFSGIIAYDVEAGHLGKDVFAKITPRVEKAADTCRSGNDAQARAQLSAIKAQYGYR